MMASTIGRLVAAFILVFGITTVAVDANVSLKNGNFFVGYTDVTVSGGMEMKIERVYNSKTDFSGIFGSGWGSEYEVNVAEQDDGSVVVHEYGGGADNVFTPTNGAPRPLAAVIADLVAAGQKSGRLTSDADVEAYRTYLKDHHQEEWDKALALGQVSAPHVDVGSAFHSGRFSDQTVTRVAEGYERHFDNGRNEAFDAKGHLQRIWDPNNNFIAFRYDERGRLAEMRDGIGNRFVVAFNAGGHVAKITDARTGRSASYEYKGSDLVKAVDTDKNVYAHEYDARHNMTRIRYSDHTTMDISYYPLAQHENVKSVKDRDGTVTEYTYTTFTPDHYTVAVTVRDAKKVSSRSSYEYYVDNATDRTLRLITVLDGDKTDTSYDENNEPTSITTADGTTTFKYDAAGHVTHKQTPSETTDLQYDPKVGKVTSVVKTADGKETFHGSYVYDPLGNLVHASDDGGHDVTLAYGEGGLISTMTDNKGGKMIHFRYNRNGKPVWIGMDGVGAITITYTATGEVAKVDSTAGRKIALQVTSAFQTLLDVVRPAGVTLSF